MAAKTALVVDRSKTLFANRSGRSIEMEVRLHHTPGTVNKIVHAVINIATILEDFNPMYNDTPKNRWKGVSFSRYEFGNGEYDIP